MEELNKAVSLAVEAIAAFKEENGIDEKAIEPGDTFVVEFNNATLIIGLDEDKKRIRTEFLGDKPLKVDMALSIYEDVD